MAARSRIPTMRHGSFHVKYLSICQSRIMRPSLEVHARNNDMSVLDLNADTLPIEHWQAVCDALATDTGLKIVRIQVLRSSSSALASADTMRKVRELTDTPVIHTRYMMELLASTLQRFLITNNVLEELYFIGLPFHAGYMQRIVRGLAANRSLRVLSFEGCRIGERGCSFLCESIKEMMNIDTLNLNGCCLNAASMRCVQEYIAMQRTRRDRPRCCRRDDDGIWKIFLNDNPEIGDAGLAFILAELSRDCFVNTVEMKRCGLTAVSTAKIMACLRKNSSLKVFDLSCNKYLTESFLQRVTAHFVQAKEVEEISKMQLLDRIKRLQKSLQVAEARIQIKEVEKQAAEAQRQVAIAAYQNERRALEEVPPGFVLVKNEELENLFNKLTFYQKTAAKVKILTRWNVKTKAKKATKLSEIEKLLDKELNRLSPKCQPSTSGCKPIASSEKLAQTSCEITADVEPMIVLKKTRFDEADIDDFVRNEEQAEVIPVEANDTDMAPFDPTDYTIEDLYGPRRMIDLLIQQAYRENKIFDRLAREEAEREMELKLPESKLFKLSHEDE